MPQPGFQIPAFCGKSLLSFEDITLDSKTALKKFGESQPQSLCFKQL